MAEAHEKAKPDLGIERPEAQITAAAGKLRELTRERIVRNQLYKFVEKVDENIAVQKVREFWDKMPHAVQWALLYLRGPLPNLYSEPLKILVRLGVLEYKGAKSEKDVTEMGKWEKLKMEWTVRIGKLFVPELAAVEPFLKPIGAVKDIQEEVLTDARYHLRETRQKKEDAVKIAEIKSALMKGKAIPAEKTA